MESTRISDAITYDWRYGRYAVLASFFINGALFANWVTRIPQIQTQHNLSEGALGLLLMGIAVGVVSALLLAGSFIARYGSRRITWVSAFVYCALFPLLPLLPTPLLLWGGLFCFGASMSMMDMAMNAQATEVEHLSGKAIMSSFHAAWSVGGVVGAIIGALAVGAGLTPTTHFIIAAFIMGLLMLTVRRWLVPQDRPTTDTGGMLRLPRRELLPLGVIAVGAAVGESTAADWSSVYMTTVVQSDASVAALGFGAFSFMMMVGRLSGDWLTERFRAHRLVRAGGLLAFVGIWLMILIPESIFALIGFGIMGAGLAVTIPLAFSAAGRLPGIPAGTGIAGVAAIGYTAFLVAPPMIGAIAEIFSLQVAMAMVAMVVGSLVFTARALQPNVKP